METPSLGRDHLQIDQSSIDTQVLPTPEELRRRWPLDIEDEEFIFHSRRQIENILQGKDPRLLMVVGPCSLHDEASTYEYAHHFRSLAAQVEKKFFLVMRAYVEKPRTKMGWKGLLYDPKLDGSDDLIGGLELSRKILLQLTQIKAPVGCEFLEINSSPYFSDLLSWGCIGARTCMSQPHRQLASHLSLPIGFKNSTDGNIDNAINGILSARTSHVFLGATLQGKLGRIESRGNPFCHLVLRGGESKSNYDAESITQALEKCQENKIFPRLMVDCSHGNSNKKEKLQSTAFESVINYLLEGKKGVMGMMLESHLLGGSQPFTLPLKHGVSVTDACLDWHQTKEMLLSAALRY
jgi:3-deoxy-7-phosphoheptulonate synthase